MKKTITMRDIADKLGISNVTVSNALSDKAGVSADLRRKIKETAVEMGYKFSTSPKTNGIDRFKNIGVIIPERFIGPYGSFYWSLYNAVIQELMIYNCYSILEILKANDERNNDIPKIIADGRVSGLIVIGQVSNQYAKMLSGITIPLVFLDFYVKDVDVDCVLHDSYFGMYRLTDYLISCGHKDIGFVGTVNATSSIQDRYMGFLKALMENGIASNSKWQIDDRDENGEYIDFVLPKPMPTAFICNCDEVAYNFIRFLKKKGYRVPEDISVAGYDNYLIMNTSVPSITTVNVSIQELAEMTAQAINELLTDRNKRPHRRVVTGDVIIKESVKRI